MCLQVNCVSLTFLDKDTLPYLPHLYLMIRMSQTMSSCNSTPKAAGLPPTSLAQSTTNCLAKRALFTFLDHIPEQSILLQQGPHCHQSSSCEDTVPARCSKARLDGALSSLAQWKLSLPMTWGLELDGLCSPFQPKLFYDSLIIAVSESLAAIFLLHSWTHSNED